MTFFDKLTVALALWGSVMTLAGAMSIGLVQYEPPSEQASLRRLWTRTRNAGVILLALATLTWIFA